MRTDILQQAFGSVFGQTFIGYSNAVRRAIRIQAERNEIPDRISGLGIETADETLQCSLVITQGKVYVGPSPIIIHDGRIGGILSFGRRGQYNADY